MAKNTRATAHNKSGCVCPLITARAYRDLPCREQTELRHNHSLTDGETKQALEVLTEGGGAAVPISKY